MGNTGQVFQPRKPDQRCRQKYLIKFFMKRGLNYVKEIVKQDALRNNPESNKRKQTNLSVMWIETIYDLIGERDKVIIHSRGSGAREYAGIEHKKTGVWLFAAPQAKKPMAIQLLHNSNFDLFIALSNIYIKKGPLELWSPRGGFQGKFNPWRTISK